VCRMRGGGEEAVGTCSIVSDEENKMRIRDAALILLADRRQE
jgi:hypothetical protein